MLDGIANLGIQSWKKNWVELSMLFELQHVDAVCNKALGAVWNEALGADWNEAQGADWNEALGAVSNEALNVANAFKIKRKIFQWRQRRKFLFQIHRKKKHQTVFWAMQITKFNAKGFDRFCPNES